MENNDLISRSELIDEIEGYLLMCGSGSVGAVHDVLDAIREARAVDAEPVRHARWQFEARGKDGMTELPVCSWCGATPKYYVPKNNVGMQVPPYCHEYGCKMDAEVENENA